MEPGTLPGVTTLMAAFDKILSAFNLNNSRGNWLYQTERNKMPMDDVSPEEAAVFFHTVEVNLNQTTTVGGWVPNAAKVHASWSLPSTLPKASKVRSCLRMSAYILCRMGDLKSSVYCHPPRCGQKDPVSTEASAEAQPTASGPAS